MRKALLDTLRKVATGLAKLAAVILLLLTIGGAWTFWDVRRVRAFCADVQPGLLLSQLAPIAKRHWVGRGLIEKQGTFDEKTKDWVFFVPAPSTMGDVVCAIHHDKVSVVSAALWNEFGPEH